MPWWFWWNQWIFCTQHIYSRSYVIFEYNSLSTRSTEKMSRAFVVCAHVHRLKVAGYRLSNCLTVHSVHSLPDHTYVCTMYIWICIDEAILKVVSAASYVESTVRSKKANHKHSMTTFIVSKQMQIVFCLYSLWFSCLQQHHIELIQHHRMQDVENRLIDIKCTLWIKWKAFL